MLNAYNTTEAFGTWVAGGNRVDDEESPRGFITLLIFDKHYNFLDAAWQQLDGAYDQGTDIETNHPFDHLVKEVTIEEEGYVYIFVSNENETLVDIHFDDLKVTHTKTSVIQYNEYYPFGLQTTNSWTREGAVGNNFLYNGPTESNIATGWGETHFRSYDPVLGRFMQVDLLASMVASHSPYSYAGNDPVFWNDPLGLLQVIKSWDDFWKVVDQLWDEAPNDGGASWSSGGGFTGGFGYDAAVSYGTAYNTMFSDGGGGGSIQATYSYAYAGQSLNKSTQTIQHNYERVITGFKYVPNQTVPPTWQPFYKSDLVTYAEETGICTKCKPHQLGNAFERIFEGLFPNPEQHGFRRNLDQTFSYSDRNTKPDFTANAYYREPSNGVWDTIWDMMFPTSITVPEGTWYEAKAKYGALYASSDDGQIRGHIDNLYQHTLLDRQRYPGFVPGLHIVTTADVGLSKSITAYAGSRVNVIHITLQFMITDGKYQFRIKP
jgi:RHS repeat-associated protein